MKSILGIIVLSLLAAAAVSCSGEGNDTDAATRLANAADAMTRISFSVTDTECPLCQPTPTVSEYAPPDRIKLSHAKGHDAWRYYLIDGDQWLVSENAELWLTGATDVAHAFLLLSDPRVLISIAKDPAVDGEEVLDGSRNHIVRAGVDGNRFVSEVLSEAWPIEQLSEGESQQARETYTEIASGLKIRLWIDGETALVSRLELDYSPLPSGDGLVDVDREDPEPQSVLFDYESPVDVPLEPEIMSYEEWLQEPAPGPTPAPTPR